MSDDDMELVQGSGNIFRDFGHANPELEQLRAILLDTRKRVLGVCLVHQGGIDTIDVCLRDCFREAVRANAAGVILLHNHPSGDPSPSFEDHRVTMEAARAGELLGIELVDHIVVAREGHVSLRRAGLFGSYARSASPPLPKHSQLRYNQRRR